MATLGKGTLNGADTTGFANGRLWAMKCTAPTDGVASAIQVRYTSQQETILLNLYGPGSTNQPGARLGAADAAQVQTNTTGTVTQTASGLSIPFSAGDVWIAFGVVATFTGNMLELDGGGASGTYTGIASAKLLDATVALGTMPANFPTIDFGPDDRFFDIKVTYALPATGAKGGGLGILTPQLLTPSWEE